MAKEYELLLVAGDDFGVKGYVRIAYCVSADMIERALPAFKKLAAENPARTAYARIDFGKFRHSVVHGYIAYSFPGEREESERDTFQIDFEKLEKSLTAKTKAVIINSPNNPSE